MTLWGHYLKHQLIISFAHVLGTVRPIRRTLPLIGWEQSSPMDEIKMSLGSSLAPEGIRFFTTAQSKADALAKASAKAFARASALLWAVVYFVLPCCRSESGTTHCCFILLTFFHTDPKSAFPAEIESSKAIQWSFLACAMILLQSLLAAFILSWVSAFWSLDWCLYITRLSPTASSHSFFHQGLLFDRDIPPPVSGIASLAASRMEETIRRFTSSRSASPAFISAVPRRLVNKSQLARS